MTKVEIIQYICDFDAFFKDAHLEDYSYHELMVIKISIDVEKSKEPDFVTLQSMASTWDRSLS